MSKKYFGTDGIRGKVNQGNINGQMFFKFGLAAGTYFKNLKKNYSINARKYAEKNFDIKNISQKFEKIFKDISF